MMLVDTVERPLRLDDLKRLVSVKRSRTLEEIDAEERIIRSTFKEANPYWSRHHPEVYSRHETAATMAYLRQILSLR